MNYTSPFYYLKNIAKMMGIIIIACTTALLHSCDPSHSHNQHAHVHDYACPMHPEVDGHPGDKCSKCGMTLEKLKEVDDTQYRMDLKADAPIIEAGKEVSLILKPINLSNESALVPLNSIHEKKIHLVIVSEDLSQFMHVHPAYTADGDYEVNVTFPIGGRYLLYADYQPAGASHQLEKQTLEVSGAGMVATKYTSSKLSSSDAGVSLTLRTPTGNFKTNQMMHIDGVLTIDGMPLDASKLDNYLQSKAYGIIIHTEDKSYNHVHGELNGNLLHMHTKLSKPGLYRAWIQFMYKGQLHTTDFVIDAIPGNGTDEAHHHHDGHDHHH
ncbi:MAG TPA: heavy metal-binding domain-containing protein [Flavobacteriales bacterium]